MRRLKQLAGVDLSVQKDIICAKFKGNVYLKVTEREYNEVCLETVQWKNVRLCDLPLKIIEG
jgi:hypothetical protein